MEKKIRFILNNETIETTVNPATVVLDYIRTERLTGTKEGCKEGDCGACTILVGELIDADIKYKSINSCLLPMGNVTGKHIITIEGLNLSDKQLNPIQEEFVLEGASQCGFCTPGFIVSMTGYLLNEGKLNYNEAVDSLDGNICRCTGHNSIIRAAEKISEKFKNNFSTNESRINFLVDNKVVPEYFLTVHQRLKQLVSETNENLISQNGSEYFVCGGTDLFVQRPEEMLKSNIRLLENEKNLSGVKVIDENCYIGCTTSVTDVLESEVFQKYFSNIFTFIELFGSTPIRNAATIGGNLNNASPIGDMTVFFLALNSIVILSNGKSEREVPLNKYYKSYKKTDRSPNEVMKGIKFQLPQGNYYFNFEKVSKRTFLDIASVNTAIFLNINDGIITNAHISAGGVAPIPMYLLQTSEFLKTKEINIENINEALSIAQSEISPISDARGSVDYKRLLLSRLIYTHFITLFPELIKIAETV